MNRSISAAAGGLIHQLRTDKGISLERLAKMAGIQSSALARIEQGLAQPSIRILDDLARQLDITVIQLLASAAKTAKASRKRLRLIAVSEPLRDALARAGLPLASSDDHITWA